MSEILVYPLGTTEACFHAVSVIQDHNIRIVDHPTPEVTHLLLDVPSFHSDGSLRSGVILQNTLRMLPKTLVICGGNLTQLSPEDYCLWDLLKDDTYLARNAAITADCALRAAAPLLKTAFAETTTLILGWGRIGKCLGQLLKAVGTNVVIAARKHSDRAMICALGHRAVDYHEIASVLRECQLLINTVPEMILTNEFLYPHTDCVKIDLASSPGLEGNDVIWARGLPGQMTPVSSGALIAETFLKHLQEAEL